jgi:hypothetical protein
MREILEKIVRSSKRPEVYEYLLSPEGFSKSTANPIYLIYPEFMTAAVCLARLPIALSSLPHERRLALQRAETDPSLGNRLSHYEEDLRQCSSPDEVLVCSIRHSEVLGEVADLFHMLLGEKSE